LLGLRAEVGWVEVRDIDVRGGRVLCMTMQMTPHKITKDACTDGPLRRVA